ncbi:hypothetical protein LPJ53_001448 [Coemansia erecta]|uniref:Importin N-terminal domain-containing protein n=1 Tax=Coemansia erecta TaxID=147472 RepID=A0A9W7Y3G6_9FUNG|nr:hypothetical protein LPJ53_001448 [Coemansia erecta]
MENNVFEALQGSLSPETNTRMRSELNLKQLELDTMFSLAVSNVALAEEAGLPVRQAAILQLRGYISRHWSIASTKYEPGPIPSQEIKSQVREKAFALLSSSDGKLRAAAAAVVAGMARYDWPDEWPQLFLQLVELLRTGTRDQTHSAMYVFSEWVNSDMSDQHMEQIGTLLPELRRIFISSDSYAVSTRAMAVRVFSDCIEIISTIAAAENDFVNTHAPPILKEWIEPIIGVFQQPVCNDGTSSNIPLKTECIKAIVRAVQGIPKHVMPYYAAILEALWMQLRDIQEPFQHAFVYENSAHNESATELLVSCEDDGEACSIDGYLLGIFEWFSKAAETRSMRKFFVTKTGDTNKSVPTPFFSQLIACLMCYAQITTEMLDDWADDMDLFVADEDEEGYRFNVRVSVQELLQTLDMTFPAALASALASAAQERTALAKQWRLEGNSNWWLASEAVLWTIGTNAESIVQQQEGNKSDAPVIELGALFDSDVWPLAQSAQFPFGQGRAFIFASGFAKMLPPGIATAFVDACAKAVADVHLHPAVRLSAVRAIGNFSRHLPAETVKPQQGTFITGLASIIPHLTEDSAHIALDALHSTLRVDQSITASLEPVISEIAIGVWHKYPGDVILTSIVIDIVEDMAGNPQACEALAQRALPVIGSAMTQNTDGSVIASGIDLLSGLIKGSPSPLPQGYTESVFPALMQVLSSTTDSEVLQSGQTCLRYFIQKDAQHIAQWRDPSGASGLELVIRFIAVLMNPEGSESAALFVGDLATKVVMKCSSLLSGEVFAELVRVVTGRLATARTSSFTSSLLPFYAHLVARHPAEVVDLLDGMRFEGRPGLQVVLDAWFRNFLDIQGYYSRKVSAIALTRLFALGDTRVSSISVQGDLIPNAANKGKIVTRSMSRTTPDQFTQVPATAKIIKLLLAEVEIDIESMFARHDGAGLSSVIDQDELDHDDGNGDGDDWEDDAEDDLQDDMGFGGKYDFLSDLIDGGVGLDAEDDDDDDDEDVLADPIYSQDLNEVLGTFLRQVVRSSEAGFGTNIEPTLTSKETMLLGKLTSSFRE